MMYLDEIFVSIQGESSDMGYPCIFIRLFGCPFHCSWCDQPQKGKMQRISTQKLISACNDFRKKTKVDRVCITGGEPLMQEDEVFPLVYELQENGFSVSIETSGLIPIEDVPYSRSYKFIMDIKCPSSGMSDKNCLDNLLKMRGNDDVVFVIKDKVDFDYMRKILRTYPIFANVLVSPVFERTSPKLRSELVNWILENKMHNVRVQVQLHKILGVA